MPRTSVDVVARAARDQYIRDAHFPGHPQDLFCNVLHETDDRGFVILNDVHGEELARYKWEETAGAVVVKDALITRHW